MRAYAYRDHEPRVDPTAYVAPGARIVGNVEIGPHASVWFNAVIRGDSTFVRVGPNTNIQDGAILHDDVNQPCIVGNDATVGHLAVVHGCRVGRGCLIGMGAIVLTGVEIGEESLVAAGSVVTGGRTYPPKSLLMGAPARHVRSLSEEEVATLIKPGVTSYLQHAVEYRRTVPS